MIRDIEDLPPELQPSSAFEANVPRQTRIEVEIPRTKQRIST